MVSFDRTLGHVELTGEVEVFFEAHAFAFLRAGAGGVVEDVGHVHGVVPACGGFQHAGNEAAVLVDLA